MSATPTRSLGIVVDCADPEGLARFWTEAIGYERMEWPHEPYVVLLPGSGEGPVLIFQRVPEPKTTKNRVHVDVYCDDAETEAQRLEGLGARRDGDIVEEHGVRWIVMADPEDNEFCVCQGGG